MTEGIRRNERRVRECEFHRCDLKLIVFLLHISITSRTIIFTDWNRDYIFSVFRGAKIAKTVLAQFHMPDYVCKFKKFCNTLMSMKL